MKYVVHPGWMKSKTDGDWHYIGFGRLCQLYGLKPTQYIINAKRSDHPTLPPIWPDDAIHLYPRYDGNYQLPEKS